jgi:hypothetical protein
MVKNYLADNGNRCPILTCELNEKDRSVHIELSSLEEANRMSKLEKMYLFSNECKVVRLGESHSQGSGISNLVTQA